MLRRQLAINRPAAPGRPRRTRRLGRAPTSAEPVARRIAARRRCRPSRRSRRPSPSGGLGLAPPRPAAGRATRPRGLGVRGAELLRPSGGRCLDAAVHRRHLGVVVRSDCVVSPCGRHRCRSSAGSHALPSPRGRCSSRRCRSRPAGVSRRTVSSWTAASSGWRTSTASRARSGDSADCRRTRWRATSSAVSCRGAAAATSSCATAPASTSTWAATRSTPRPSATTSRELVIHDKAGERILEGLLVDAERRLREEGIAGDVYLFKNNTDSAGNSYGCHENYLVGRHGEFSRLADILIPFLVTRQIICGAGKVLQTPRGAVYCVSQRAEHIWEGVSLGDHPVAADHQHPRRAARRRRALPPAARHRRRLEHVRDDDAAQGRRHRPGAAHDRGERRDARPDPGEPDPGDPRDQPRHHRPAQGAAGQRPRGRARWRSSASTSTKAVDFADRRGLDEGVVKQVLELWGRTLRRDRDRRTSTGRHRDRLGDEVQADRAVQRQAQHDAVVVRGSPR